MLVLRNRRQAATESAAERGEEATEAASAEEPTWHRPGIDAAPT